MQKLSLARIQIQSAARDRDEESGQLLDSALELMREALAELRTLQFEISPPVLCQQGLAAALRWLAESMSERSGIPLMFRASSPLPELDSSVAVSLFQCVRELVFNLIKHADASRGWLDLGCSDGMLTLSVSDDGKGDVPDPASPMGQSRQGFGLFAIRERLRLMDGEPRFERGAAGAVATISVPEGRVMLCRED
jgi:signal transduction histidine kinase